MRISVTRGEGGGFCAGLHCAYSCRRGMSEFAVWCNERWSSHMAPNVPSKMGVQRPPNMKTNSECGQQRMNSYTVPQSTSNHDRDGIQLMHNTYLVSLAPSTLECMYCTVVCYTRKYHSRSSFTLLVCITSHASSSDPQFILTLV